MSDLVTQLRVNVAAYLFGHFGFARYARYVVEAADLILALEKQLAAADDVAVQGEQSRMGWESAIELGIIPIQHQLAASILGKDMSDALTAYHAIRGGVT